MEIEVKKLTNQSFAKYGKVVGIPKVEPDERGDFGKWWADIATCSIEGGEIGFGLCLTKKRVLEFSEIERHLRSPELNVSMGGDMICVVGAAENLENKEFRPDPQKMEVFLVKRDQAILMDAAVWHGAPFPVNDEKLAILVVLRNNTFTFPQDVYNFDLESNIRIVL